MSFAHYAQYMETMATCSAVIAKCLRGQNCIVLLDHEREVKTWRFMLDQTLNKNLGPSALKDCKIERSNFNFQIGQGSARFMSRSNSNFERKLIGIPRETVIFNSWLLPRHLQCRFKKAEL